MGSIILLSGPVGAGKSTVAQELICLSGDAVVYIEGDRFWKFIARNEHRFNRVQNFKMTMSSMVAATLPYAMSGYEVIVDFTIPPWFLDTVAKIARLRNVPLDYVVIRPGKDVCAARAASREEGKITDYSPLLDFYHTFIEAGKNAICDDESDAATIAGQIRNGLDAGIFRVV